MDLKWEEWFCDLNEIKWLKERFREFGIINLVKAVNAWVGSAFGNI